MDILMGIRLNVSLRFGNGQLPLRDILELGPDSVVELDQRVEEPVELLIGGRVIARGEVVTTNGSYGLRISEIVAPQSAPRVGLGGRGGPAQQELPGQPGKVGSSAADPTGKEEA